MYDNEKSGKYYKQIIPTKHLFRRSYIDLLKNNIKSGIIQ